MVIYYPSHPYSDNPKASIKFAFEICYDLEFRRELTIYSPIRETHFFHENLLKLGLPPMDYVKRDLKIIEGFMNHDGHESMICAICPKHGRTEEYKDESWICDCYDAKFDSGVILLLSNTAFEKLDIKCIKDGVLYCYKKGIRLDFHWLSKGCEKEYTYAKAHHIRVYELESFLEGKEVLL